MVDIFRVTLSWVGQSHIAKENPSMVAELGPDDDLCEKIFVF